jgi:hypothetical protein
MEQFNQPLNLSASFFTPIKITKSTTGSLSAKGNEQCTSDNISLFLE